MTLGMFLILGAGAAIVAGLAQLLRSVGREMARCPVNGAASRATSLVVLGVFVSMGLGATGVVAALVSAARTDTASEVVMGTGIVAILLGIGFSIAATVLRDVMRAVPPMPAQEPEAEEATP